MVKDQLIPYEELMKLREQGFRAYSANAEKPNEGVYYYENGKLHYDMQCMYSSSSHEGQIIAATYAQAAAFIDKRN